MHIAELFRYNSNFYKGLESALDLSPLKELAPIRFPSDWTDQREKDFFLFLLFVSESPFYLEWTEGEVHIYFPADGDWGRERKGLAPIHILPITEVKKYLPYFFMQTMRMFYINDPELTAAKSNLEDEVFDLSESIKAEL